MNYTQENEALTWSQQLSSGPTLKLRAAEIHRERTGIHAKISISLNEVALSWSVLNIERDTDRTHLSNSAFKHFGSAERSAYSAASLKHDLDLFCGGLWEEQQGQFLPVGLSGAEEDAPVSFYLKPFVVQGAGTLIYALPGSGKSWWAILAAVAIDAGINGIWPVRQAKVLFINLERSGLSVSQRLARANQALGLHRSRKLLMLNAKGRSLRDVSEAISKAVQQAEVQVVFLDSISRSGFASMVEDDNVNSIMDLLNRLCPTWLAIAHTPRGDQSHVYGSVMFDAAADIVARVSSQEKRDERKLGVGVEIVKANDVPKEAMHVISLQFDDGGITSVKRASPVEFPELDTSHKYSLTEEIALYLKEVGRASASEIAKELDRNRANISVVLNSHDGFMRVGKEGKEVFYGLKT